MQYDREDKIEEVFPQPSESAVPAQDAKASEAEQNYTPNFILAASQPDVAKAAGSAAETGSEGNNVRPAYTAAPPQEQQWTYSYNTSDVPPTPPTPPDEPVQPKAPRQKRSGKTGIALLMVLCVLLSELAGFAGSWFAHDLRSEADVQQADGSEKPEAPSVSIPSFIDTTDGLTYAELAALVSPTVVQITTEYTVANFWMQETATGAGSGVIISDDGTVVTNHHVVEDANRVQVILSTGEEYEASLVATDAQTDIAVLKIEAENLPCAEIGDSDDLVVGQEVIAVGNPLGELGGTVTNGIISAVDRTIMLDDYAMSLIQTNTAINPGNSGGGLFDASGRLIGIVNAKYSDTGVEGLGFAIPINTAMNSAQDLIDVGYVTGRISVGLNLLTIRDQQTAFQYRVSEFGVYVYSTVKGSSAELAGFKTGDLILSVDGIEIETSDDIKDIFNDREVGEALEVKVLRGDKEVELQLVLTEYSPVADESAK